MEDFNLEQMTGELFQGFQIDQAALWEAVMGGDMGGVAGIFMDALITAVENPFLSMKEHLISLCIIGIGAMVLKQLGLFFKDSQVQKIGFWIVYLLLARQLLELYYSGEKIATACLEGLLEFGQVFVPLFSAVLTLASGNLTGTGYIATLLFIIYVIEQFLLYIMVPVVEAYMLISLLGALWQPDRVEKLMDFLEKGLGIGFKIMYGVVMGIGALQSMILPFVDHTKVGSVKKILESIPGVGTVTGNGVEILFGSAVLLKNGIGVLGLLLLLLFVAAPLVKIGLICVVMRLSSVIYSLFGESHLTWCAEHMGQAEGYLWKIIGAAGLLFLLWILLAVYTTNQRLYM